MLDLLIKNGEIVDGTGSESYQADIGIKSNEIVMIKPNIDQDAYIVIDASGYTVTPGFIDIHGNSEWTLPANNKGESKIRQGVTTEVQGHCGFSAAPVIEKNSNHLLSYLANTALLSDEEKKKWNWRSQAEFMRDEIEKNGIPFNIAPMVGHGTIKIGVMGFEKREPTSKELDQMTELLKFELENGLFGMSSGLQYEPGFYSSKKEINALANVLKEYDRVYTTHMRSEGKDVFESINESIDVSNDTGVSVLITHLKLSHQPHWGEAKKALNLIDHARNRGLDIDFDIYPYDAYGSGLIDLMPPWVKEDGAIQMATLLTDKKIQSKVIEEMKMKHDDWDNPLIGLSWDDIKIALLTSDKNKIYEGMTITEIADKMSVSPYQAVINLLIDEKGGIKSIYFAIDEDDVETFMKHPRSILSSDGRAVAPYGLLGEGSVHPRYYGTFPRILGRYVRDKKVISLEEGIKKITSLPAKKMKINKRGVLKEGYYADIAIFNKENIIDLATFDEPHQYSIGVKYVIVNGKVVVEKSEHTGVLPGNILKRK
ncbi:N-acyl-D-amino-acid deacylase family protein [Pseudogracilibacillus sp. SO30301A]|uniref:N-acyl-D-amino-acid deacylase family protein n=1 Tax=Pseudogracilibacillus sp. SO30301A TaxID=3098291 RepID=UPI00300E5CEC